MKENCFKNCSCLPVLEGDAKKPAVLVLSMLIFFPVYLPRGNHPTCRLNPKQKVLLQFLYWPLGAGSKTKKIPIGLHVKMANFAAELNILTALTKTASFWSLQLALTSMTTVWEVDYFCTTSDKIIWRKKADRSEGQKSFDAVWLTASHWLCC